MKFPIKLVISFICMGSLLIHLPIHNFILSSSAQIARPKIAVDRAELPEDTIRDTARLITLRIFSIDRQEWEKSSIDTITISGSGILINKQTKKQGQQSIYLYLVLTNQHILKSSNPSNNGYYIQTHDGLLYKAFPQKQVKFDNNDIGLFWFYSPYSYEKAVLGNSFNLKNKSQVFVAGFPCELSSPTMACPAEFTFTKGEVFLIDKPLADGYQIGYTNDTKEGMSGGPILNKQGQLVGINGRGKYDAGSSQYKYADGSGTPEVTKEISLALGIPIETYLKLVPKNPFDKIAPPPKEVKYILYSPKNISNTGNSKYQVSKSNNGDSLSGGWKILLFIGLLIIILLLIVLPIILLVLQDINKEIKTVIKFPYDIAELKINANIAVFTFLKDKTKYQINLQSTENDVIFLLKYKITIQKEIMQRHDQTIFPIIVESKESYKIIQKDRGKKIWILRKMDNKNSSVVIKFVNSELYKPSTAPEK